MAEYAERQPSKLPIYFLVLLIGLALAVQIASTQASTHAVVKHGVTATEIVNCLHDKGPYMVYRAKDNKFYLPCQLPDGGFGLGIFTDKGINVTAFQPGDGTWNTVRAYIEKFATRFTGGLPF